MKITYNSPKGKLLDARKYSEGLKENLLRQIVISNVSKKSRMQIESDNGNGRQFSQYRTTPVANSTMIQPRENSVSIDDPQQFIPSTQSTMIDEFLPCASSTMLEKKQIGCKPSTTTGDITGIETWSINGSDTTLIHHHYLKHHQLHHNSTCPSIDHLSTIDASTVCRDEFSMESFQEETIILNSRTDQQVKPMEKQFNLETNIANKKSIENVVLRKQRMKRSKFIQAMNYVKKNVMHKTKHNGKSVIKHIETPVERVMDVYHIKDKKAVARKLHRFRQNVGRNGASQLQTLALL